MSLDGQLLGCNLCAFAALTANRVSSQSLAKMEFLVEELGCIINELTEIRNNLQHGLDLAKMKEICERRKLALEKHRMEYEARAANERITKSVTRDPDDPEDEID